MEEAEAKQQADKVNEYFTMGITHLNSMKQLLFKKKSDHFF
jgi:hypothetical protein